MTSFWAAVPLPADSSAPDVRPMSAAGRAAALRARKRRERAARANVSADFRAENEDDDGYDPYSDYMDQLSRSSYEEPEEDPWR